MYDRGLGTAQDLIEAYKWYTLLLQRAPEAPEDIAETGAELRLTLQRKMSAAQLETAMARARAWRSR